MKVTYYALAFIVCANAMALILQSWGVSPMVMNPYNPTDLEYNATAILESLEPYEKEFYDVGGGIQWLWNQNVPIIEEAFTVFTALGMSENIKSILLGPWRFFWMGWLLSFISGRDFMP